MPNTEIMTEEEGSSLVEEKDEARFPYGLGIFTARFWSCARLLTRNIRRESQCVSLLFVDCPR